jgi:hypothetical protein
MTRKKTQLYQTLNEIANNFIRFVYVKPWQVQFTCGLTYSKLLKIIFELWLWGDKGFSYSPNLPITLLAQAVGLPLPQGK